MTSLKRANDWLFGWGSPTSLGLIRIATGVISLVNTLLLLWQVRDWFTEDSFHPVWVSQLWLGPYPTPFGIPVPRIDLMRGIHDVNGAMLFLGVTAVLSVLVALGVWTKAVTILLALFTVSIQHRSPAILHGGDTVLRLLTIYLALSPCGLACSVDRLRGLWKGTIPPGPISAPLWTQRLIQINTSLLYFTAVWAKWGGPTWRDGSAAWYPNRLQEFERFWVPPFLREYPFVPILTYTTLFTEFAMVSLVYYRPYRKWILGIAAGMHLYIDYSMNIPLFSYLMITLYLSFFDGEEVAGWARRVGERLRRWRVAVPVRNLTPAREAALAAADPFRLVEFREADAPPSGREARAAALRCPGAWWLACVPGAVRRILHG